MDTSNLIRVRLRYAPVWASFSDTPSDGKVEEWWQTEIGNAGRRNERGTTEPTITVCGRVDMILRARLGRVRGEVDELTVEIISDPPEYTITEWEIGADGSVPDGLAAVLDPWKNQTLAWVDEINAVAAEHRRQTRPGGPDANAWGNCVDCGKGIHYAPDPAARLPIHDEKPWCQPRDWFHDDGSTPRNHHPHPGYVPVEEETTDASTT